MELKSGYYRVSVKALVWNEDKTKFLLIQENNGKWEFPGGGLEWGEDTAEGLRREVYEEMSLEISQVSDQPLLFVSSKFEARDGWAAAILYEAKLNTLSFTPSPECVAIKFVTVTESQVMDLFVGAHAIVKKLESLLENDKLPW